MEISKISNASIGDLVNSNICILLTEDALENSGGQTRGLPIDEFGQYYLKVIKLGGYDLNGTIKSYDEYISGSSEYDDYNGETAHTTSSPEEQTTTPAAEEQTTTPAAEEQTTTPAAEEQTTTPAAVVYSLSDEIADDNTYVECKYTAPVYYTEEEATAANEAARIAYTYTTTIEVGDEGYQTTYPEGYVIKTTEMTNEATSANYTEEEATAANEAARIAYTYTTTIEVGDEGYQTTYPEGYTEVTTSSTSAPEDYNYYAVSTNGIRVKIKPCNWDIADTSVLTIADLTKDVTTEVPDSSMFIAGITSGSLVGKQKTLFNEKRVVLNDSKTTSIKFDETSDIKYFDVICGAHKSGTSTLEVDSAYTEACEIAENYSSNVSGDNTTIRFNVLNNAKEIKLLVGSAKIWANFKFYVNE